MSPGKRDHQSITHLVQPLASEEVERTAADRVASEVRPVLRMGRRHAERRFEMAGVTVTDPKAAQCGEVLKGVLKPHQCKLFGNECTPERPIGALMVSSEGSCAAYYDHVYRRSAAAR